MANASTTPVSYTRETAVKGAQIVLATSTTSANVEVPFADTFSHIHVKNMDSTNAIYIALGTDDNVAAVGPTDSISDLVLGPGEWLDLRLPADVTYIAALAAASTPTLHAFAFDLVP